MSNFIQTINKHYVNLDYVETVRKPMSSETMGLYNKDSDVLGRVTLKQWEAVITIQERNQP